MTVQDYSGNPSGGAANLPFTTIDFPETVGPMISNPNPLIMQLRVQWDLVDSLWEGTTAMRAKGQTYLPKTEMETPQQYQQRLSRSTLYNSFKKTIQNGVGRVMSIPIVIKSDSAPLNLFCDDVDTQCRSITQFGKEVLANMLRHGVSYILTDYSRIANDYATLADEQLSGARPYWVSIPATNVLDARSGFVGGKERLVLFRYEEIVNEMNSQDFTASQYRQVRIFQLDTDGTVNYAVYRLANPNSGNWTLQDKGVLPFLTDIPVAPCYGDRIGFFMGKPVLMDLAEKNVEHWQLNSDITNIVRYATIPILFGRGLTTEIVENGAVKQVTISPQQGIFTADPAANLSWVEIEGKSISTAQALLDTIETHMERLGMSLTTSQPGTLTATEKSITTAEANSLLKSIAMNLQEAFEHALFHVSQFLSSPTQDISVNVNTQYAVDYADQGDYQLVLQTYAAGIINKETVLEEGRRRNILDPQVDIEEMLATEPIAPPPLNNVDPPVKPASIPPVQNGAEDGKA